MEPLARQSERPSVPTGAALIDFENLVFGLASHSGHEALPAALCLTELCAVVRELVRPGVRRAYGDWRLRDLNQFQVDLHRHGYEAVQVLGRLAPGTRKNAADVRLAVDAVEAALTAPHLARFVIVSGDRDLIDVVRCLQKHGREVVGIAPEWSASAELCDACDRFLTYREIQRRAGYELPRRAVSAVAAPAAPAGGPRIGTPDGAQDPAGRAPARFLPSQVQLVARAHLSTYRYESDPARRRALLRALHAAASRHDEFSLSEVRGALSSPSAGGAFRPAEINKCWTVLYQGRAFDAAPVDALTPLQHRRHRLSPDVRGAEDFVRIYERSVAYKLVEHSRGEPTAQEVRVLLGLQEEDLGWCAELLSEVRRLLLAT